MIVLSALSTDGFALAIAIELPLTWDGIGVVSYGGKWVSYRRQTQFPTVEFSSFGSARLEWVQSQGSSAAGTEYSTEIGSGTPFSSPVLPCLIAINFTFSGEQLLRREAPWAPEIGRPDADSFL